MSSKEEAKKEARELSRDRSLYLVRRLRERPDARALQQIESYEALLHFMPLDQLMICQQAWDYIQTAGIKPQLVFAHPDLLVTHPTTSVHYRGLCGLSQKRIQTLAVNVSKWEDGTAQHIRPASFLQVARIYNTIMSSIIVESTKWTLENGYRTIVATLGIQLDGSIRNIIGDRAQTEIQDYLCDWLEEQGFIQCRNAQGTLFTLKGPLESCQMEFGSEPDIEFRRGSQCKATIEIKGGTDEAGALERLGAMQKSFEETPVNAKNFLVVGVITPTMRTRLDQAPHLEQYFQLSDLHQSPQKRAKFMEEIFNHALRITSFTAS